MIKTWDLMLCDGDSGKCHATMEEYPDSCGDYILVDDLLQVFCTNSAETFQEILATIAIKRKG